MTKEEKEAAADKVAADKAAGDKAAGDKAAADKAAADKAAADKAAADKETAEKKYVTLRHKTQYAVYRRAGIIITAQPKEYPVTAEQLSILNGDPWVEVIKK